jgi:hypothetical protein
MRGKRDTVISQWLCGDTSPEPFHVELVLLPELRKSPLRKDLKEEVSVKKTLVDLIF